MYFFFPVADSSIVVFHSVEGEEWRERVSCRTRFCTTIACLLEDRSGLLPVVVLETTEEPSSQRFMSLVYRKKAVV